jgi:hypothetical protein
MKVVNLSKIGVPFPFLAVAASISRNISLRTFFLSSDAERKRPVLNLAVF